MQFSEPELFNHRASEGTYEGRNEQSYSCYQESRVLRSTLIFQNLLAVQRIHLAERDSYKGLMVWRSSQLR
ncbi:hypothetical protein FRX31_017700 [Thalictrum thalictroides]|uniref:Uncharacterized protein n=1 Tax=Thalictrum thalictroides TaxID=46969 RepID=A0A7J6W8Q8_THATH|nr:hypothetical protein FRX31_017700 [Thalictrum thalictroides]